jgi:hypothetical protein
MMDLPPTDQGLNLLDLLPSPEALARIAQERSSEYQANQPFPHIIIDDFLPEPVARSSLAAFPGPEAAGWYEYRNDRERKLGSVHEQNIPPAIRNVLYALNSATFLTFLEKLTGIPGLVPDPHFFGGGMHQIVRDGKLAVHVDFNRHPGLRLDRRLNLLLYLNEDWPDEYGGHLELWDAKGNSAVTKVLPVFNRCVVFSTTRKSYHGHPHPLACPPDRSRKSIALYYYTNGRPAEEAAPEHSTIFAGDSPPAPTPVPRVDLVQGAVRATKRAARLLIPPIIYRILGR